MKPLFISILIVFSLSAYSQENFIFDAPKFQKLDLRDGLTNLNVSSIVQDDLGYIWIATARGLNRYDGTSFKHYLFSENDNSLYNDMVSQLHKNHEGYIFCGTINGINIFDTNQDKMYRIQDDNGFFFDFIDFGNKTFGISHLSGLCVYNKTKNSFDRLPHIDNDRLLKQLISDEKTGIWSSSVDNVLSFVPFSSNPAQNSSESVLVNYDPLNDAFRKFFIPENNGDYSDGPIIKIDSLILLSGKSFRTFNLNSLEFTPFPKKWSELSKLRNFEIWFVSLIDKHTLWIGTRTNGLYIFNLETNTLVNINKENSDLKSNWPTCILKDLDNNIWLGTFDHGVNIAFKNRGIVNTDNTLNNLAKDRFINSIISDKRDHYYLGTRYDGLFIYNAKSKNTRHLHTENSFLSSNHIISAYIDSQNKLWVSDEEALHITNFKSEPLKEYYIPGINEGMGAICEHGDKIFASSDAQGFFIFDLNGSFIKQELALGNNISQIIPISHEELLVASYEKGIFRYHIESGTYENIYQAYSLFEDNRPQVITIHLDADSVLWIGNYVGGLHKLDLKNGTVKVYTMEDGLPNNDIVGIAEDQSGALWLSTSYGISRFDKKQEFINFFYNEGLENLQFHAKSAHLDRHGIIYFGGSNGLNYFDPLVLSQSINKKAPTVILEKLTILNKEITPGDETKILSEILNKTDQIDLNHRQNSISIDYHAFDFVAANEIRYSYKLDGLEKEWNNVGKRSIAIFSNLDPGNYIFMIKAKNNWGIWSEISSLKINIKPSAFLSIWAFIIYTLLILLITYITFQLILRAQLYKSRLELEQNERLRENEVAQMKMRFFTNISHEIRTPLTLIKGNVDLLSDELAEKNIKIDSFTGLRYSTNRLLSLVNQLLSFRKLENDALDLKLKREDLIQITGKLIQPFIYVASSRDIELKIDTVLDKLLLPIDADKYEKIMSNLLSNSLKHVSEKGKISIKIEVPEEDDSFVKISVRDNGSGIPEEDLAHIFERFAQSKTDKEKQDYSGTGIGLDFTKRLVELHHGEISVSSKRGVETIFSVVLPLNDKTYAKASWVSTGSVIESGDMADQAEETYETASNKEKALILLVEDDLELNRFISSSLNKQFNVLSCYNGKEGIKLAQNQLPELIISDIMMPELDGFELCKQVREDELISHIPIILLTAKPDDESKIAGYKYGADDYIMKPFEQNILMARIYNLIESRKKLQGFYKQGIIADPQVDISNQFELNFVKRIESILASEYQSPALNVNQLADKMNMSRTNFYRKFMNVMDVSPKDFITRYRINKSIELIKDGVDNFGEISLLCGFGSQSNYSAIFKREKGVTPLQFKKRL